MLGPSPSSHSFLVMLLGKMTRTHLQTVTVDDQVKAYIKKIMSQLNKWMTGGKISKLVIVITDKETGENVERWQFDVTSPLCYLLPCHHPFVFAPSKRMHRLKTDWHFKRSKSSINLAKRPSLRNPATTRTPHLRIPLPISLLSPRPLPIPLN